MSRLQRNFILLAGSNLLAPMASMALVLAIARLHGAEMLGKYSLLMTVFVLGQSCVGLGLPVLITREVSRQRAEAGRYVVNACAVTGVILGPVLAVAAAVAARASDRELGIALALVIGALLPSMVIVHAEAVLLAFERAGDLVTINVLENTVRAAAGVAIVLLGGGLIALAASLLVLRAGAMLAFLAALRRRGVAGRGALDGAVCRTMLRAVPVLGAIPIVNALYARADVLLLTALGSWAQLGLYSAALRLVDVARTLAPAYARALYPVLARLRTESEEAFAVLVRRATREITILVLPVVIALAAFAEPVMAMLYGEQLAGGAMVLRILAWSLVPTTVAATLAQILFAAGLQGVDLRVNIIATVFVAVAAAAAITLWGAGGAATAVLLASALYAALQYAWVRRAVVDPGLGPMLARLAAVAAAGVLAILAASSAPALAAGAVAALASAAAVWATRVVRREDVQWIADLLGGRARQANSVTP